MPAIRPIFIFSLPRSGSTLLQRILSSHKDIASVSEPWILLPFLSIFNSRDIYTDYMQFAARVATAEFVQELNHGVDSYREYLAEMVCKLYKEACGGKAAIYFLDKTPRYYLIAEEIIKTFPSAKIIFLWRNPMAVAASMLDAWGKGKWNLFKHNVDLYDGVEALCTVYEKYKGNYFSMNYDTFVTKPKEILASLCNYLEIEYFPEMLKEFDNVKYKGQFVDPTGIQKYHQVSTGSVETWKEVCTQNPLRRIWFRHYLSWIGERRLSLIGESYQNIDDSLKSNKHLGVISLLSDATWMVYGIFYITLEPLIMKDKFKDILSGKVLKIHA